MSLKIRVTSAVLFLFAFLGLASAQTPVVGTFTLGGQVIANGTVALVLDNCGVAPTAGSSTYNATLTASGVLTMAVQGNAGNGCALPGQANNSYYQATLRDSSGNLIWRHFYIVPVQGTNWDLSTEPGLAVLPPAVTTGQQGEPGQSATIEVGSVTTIAAGQQATVNNSGTDSNAVLDFEIPQGPAGPTSVLNALAHALGYYNDNNQIVGDPNTKLDGAGGLSLVSLNALNISVAPNGEYSFYNSLLVSQAGITSPNANTFDFGNGTNNDTTGIINAGTLNISNFGSSPMFSTSSRGLVPSPSGVVGTTRYLREDGTWSAPAGSGVSMTYPGVGIGVSTGSTWGTSLVAPMSTLVGISDVQPLTNKSINASEINSGVLSPAQIPTNINITGNAATATIATTATNATTAATAATATTAGNLTGTPVLPNGITANTQTASDNTAKLATDAFVQAALAGVPTLAGNNTFTGGLNTFNNDVNISMWGGGLFQVGESAAGPSGLFLQWNHATGSQGETDFVNSQGGGPGGFNFYNIEGGNALGGPLMSIDSSGDVGIAGYVTATGHAAVSSSVSGFAGGTSGGFGYLGLVDAGAATDDKIVDFVNLGNDFQGRFANDANTTAAAWIDVSRSGITPIKATFGEPVAATSLQANNLIAGNIVEAGLGGILQNGPAASSLTSVTFNSSIVSSMTIMSGFSGVAIGTPTVISFPGVFASTMTCTVSGTLGGPAAVSFSETLGVLTVTANDVGNNFTYICTGR
jgi:hypothetical protein